MLVVTANWAIADGTLLAPPRREQVEWIGAVHRAAIRAGVRRDGRYAPVDRVDVVFAGDTLDGLTSTVWLDAVRPWHEGSRAARAAATVMVAAANRGRPLLAAVSRWARKGLPLPGADRWGRPAVGREHRAAVRVTFLPGDRDRWLAAASARIGRHGLGVAAAWSADGVAVCHGAEADPVCSAAEPGRPTLAASLAVDLVARFAAAVRSRADLWPACRPLVARLGAARPFALPLLVADWLARVEPASALAPAVREAWRTAVSDWHRRARLDEPDCGAGCDPIDAIAGWLDGDGRRSRTAEGDVAAVLDVTARPARPAAGTLVVGHLPASATERAVVGLAVSPRPATPAAATGVDVACVAPDRGRSGPTGVVFADRGRPDAWEWMVPGSDHPALDAPAPPVAHHRIVEAA